MSKKVITPVGSSLFINFDKKNPSSITKWFTLIEKSDRDDYKTPLEKRWDEHKSRCENIAKKVRKWVKPDIQQNASAEITSILNILREEQTDIDVYLLASETIVSRLAAEILTEVLQGHRNNTGHTVTVHFNSERDIIAKLQIRNQQNFEKIGLKNLIDRIYQITEGDFDNVLLNITGGYKATIPHLSTLGQIEKTPLRYIFEDSTELMNFPYLPVDFDFSIIEDNYIAFECFANKKDPKNWPSLDEFKKDLSADVGRADKEFQRLHKEYQLVEVVEQKVQLTALGQLLMTKYQQLIDDDEDGTLERMKIIGKLAELKVFQHYVIELGQSASVIPGKTISGFDIDVYIEETDGSVTAIEVKTGANPPILSRKSSKKRKKENTIERNILEGGFHHLLEQQPSKQLNLMVILYYHKDIHPRNMSNIQQIHTMYPEKTQNLGWYQLCLPPNYKMNAKWEVKNNLKYLDGKKLIIGGKYV